MTSEVKVDEVQTPHCLFTRLLLETRRQGQASRNRMELQQADQGQVVQVLRLPDGVHDGQERLRQGGVRPQDTGTKGQPVDERTGRSEQTEGADRQAVQRTGRGQTEF